MTGSTREQQIYDLFGRGANGKSVLVNTITGIMNDYAKAAPLELLTVTKNEQHPTELAMLCGARMITIAETESNKQWAEARLKQLTGEDPIAARFMRQDFFEYMPQFTPIVLGQHRPGLNSVNEAIKRRIRMIRSRSLFPKRSRTRN
jgi:putative DNA primase/helicase